MQSDISELRSKEARTAERLAHLAQRVARLEEWRRSKETDASDTARTEIDRLEAELARREAVTKAEIVAADRQYKRDRREVLVKAGLVIFGALAALAASAITRALGW